MGMLGLGLGSNACIFTAAKFSTLGSVRICNREFTAELRANFVYLLLDSRAIIVFLLQVRADVVYLLHD